MLTVYNMLDGGESDMLKLNGIIVLLFFVYVFLKPNSIIGKFFFIGITIAGLLALLSIILIIIACGVGMVA